MSANTDFIKRVSVNERYRMQTPDLFQLGVSVTNGYFDVGKYIEVIRGERIAYLAKGVIPEIDCNHICQEYSNHKDKYQYSVKPMIEAIGQPLYLADQDTIKEYFEKSADMQHDISTIFNRAGTKNYSEHLFNSIRDYLNDKHHVHTRKIQYGDNEGFYGIMRSWGSSGVDAIGRATRLHEDRLQLRLHTSLETGMLLDSSLASTCVYYSNGINKTGGELKIYDIRPGLEDVEKEELNGQFKYGFDDRIINNIPFITIAPQAGDIVTFLADRLHEVFGVKEGHRINSTFFSALLPDSNTNLIWS